MRYSNMNKETIFYSIMYQDSSAISIIPELANAYNMTPHRITKEGEVINIPINRTLGRLSFVGGQDWIHPIVNTDNISIVFDANNTGAVRVARPVIQYCDPNGCKNLVQFASLHLGVSHSLLYGPDHKLKQIRLFLPAAVFH